MRLFGDIIPLSGVYFLPPDCCNLKIEKIKSKKNTKLQRNVKFKSEHSRVGVDGRLGLAAPIFFLSDGFNI